MKKIIFTEEFCSPENLFPFTLTRKVQDIRVGSTTIREKWEQLLELDSFDRNENDYKNHDKTFELDHASIGNDLIYLIHGNVLPTQELAKQVRKLKKGEFISVTEKESIAYCIGKDDILNFNKIRVTKAIELKEELIEINFPWDILRLNKWAIEEDVRRFKKLKKFQKCPESNQLINPSQVFMEKGASAQHCIFNASDGPIFIGKNALVMEGSLLRGPISIGEGATIKMGSKIYGATSIGPYCTVGGEIKNSVIFGFSNKAHDGYLGDSVIGEWCNMGAGTSNSNIKNNASSIMVWTPKGQVNVGLKCGVFMGDYSRTAINTSINTGTVIGVCSNVFGTGLTPKYIPSFSWGNDGVERYLYDKALLDIQNWKSLKQRQINANEKSILKHIFDHY